MPLLILASAFATAVLSAAALYAASRHCRWMSWRRLGKAGQVPGLLLAVASLLLWGLALGPGAGLCAMLGTWMLAMMALPYAANLGISSAAGNGEQD
jgi:biotin transporter BioY